MVITILHERFSTIWEKLDFFSKKNMVMRNFLPYFMKKIETQFLTSFMVIYLPYFHMNENYVYFAYIWKNIDHIFYMFINNNIDVISFQLKFQHLIFINTHMEIKQFHRIF